MALTTKQQRIVDGIVADLRNSLMEKGFTPDAAQRFARVALSSKKVRLGKGGNIWYEGKKVTPDDFAGSKLIDFVTGAKAKADNQAAIQSDPTYLTNMANLAYQRDNGQGTTPGLIQLADDRRNALLDFGDPNFVVNDPVLQQAVEANKFSTSALLREANNRNLSGIAQASNKAGTLLGGGFLSGKAEALRQYAGNQADAATALTRLLTSNNQGVASLNTGYELGQRNSLLQAQQALAAAGVLKAETPPDLQVGPFRFRRPPVATGGQHGGGGRGGPTDHGPQGGGGGTGVRTSHYGNWRNGQWVPWQPGTGGGGGIPRPPRPGGGTGNPPRAGGGGGGIPAPPPPRGGGGGGGGGGAIPPPPPPHGRPLPSPSPPWNPNQWHPSGGGIPAPPPPLGGRRKRRRIPVPPRPV